MTIKLFYKLLNTKNTRKTTQKTHKKNNINYSSLHNNDNTQLRSMLLFCYASIIAKVRVGLVQFTFE